MKNVNLYNTAIEEIEELNWEPEMPEFDEELRVENHGQSTYVFEKKTKRLFAVVETIPARRGGIDHLITFTQTNDGDGYFDTEVWPDYEDVIFAINLAYRWDHR